MTALVQFAEKNFSRRDISKLSGDGILVRSIWRTIQGEGPFAGMPATFIRLGGCNRGAKTDSCAFCDTDFLVSRSSVYSVANLVQSVASLPEKLVVITGGEPVMHPKLDELVSALLAAGYRVQL